MYEIYEEPTLLERIGWALFGLFKAGIGLLCSYWVIRIYAYVWYDFSNAEYAWWFALFLAGMYVGLHCKKREW